MKTSSAVLCAGLMLSVSVATAEEYDSYPHGVINKAGNGFANVVSAPMEIPKNIINTTNDSNIVFGVVGGLLKGTVHMVGRIGVGVADLVTAPIPTKPVVHPELVWDDFDADTQYGSIFRLADEYE
ncbi:MAG: exosortase system-associated protein, TIGR04073 family [Methylococcales bacterium]|nr:exosortase system-associated protein, TIGR04073 family [Methylococcales bacterium]